jgi:subtilisin family serine protease
MAELPHFILPRAEVDLERRKMPGFGTSTERTPATHSQTVRRAVEEALESHNQLRRTVVDPELIVRVRVAHMVPEDQWVRAGLAVLGHDGDDSVILFSSDNELQEFRFRLAAYGEGAPAGQKHPQYDALIGAIEELRPLEPRDRIGPALRAEGFRNPDFFDPDGTFILDVELWEVGGQDVRAAQVNGLEGEIARQGGELADRYIGVSFTALRVIGNGALVQWLLTLPLVRSIDRPPEVDIDAARLLETTIADVGSVEIADEDLPVIGIIDSGINDAHPILRGIVTERLSVPVSLGLNDEFGHGSKVCGIAAYGNVRGCLERRDFQPQARLASGKIINDTGGFDDRSLVPSQIDAVVRRLHRAGCRIFNISLGDRQSRYADGKVGLWTAVLDLLARELNVLFVVSCGNYEHVPEHGNPEDHLVGYPHYLVTERSRILEPAPAANALTVGAIAHAAAVREQTAGDVGLRPIAEIGEPAPFTRSGPGVRGAMKPELCDDGGNIVYDGFTQNIQRQPESEVFTVYHRYLERLFTTARGTSYAAPLVSHKAAVVLRAFPNASANLLRALLVNSAYVPAQAIEKLRGLGDDAVTRVCGYGVPETITAVTSDTNRVVLYADAQIGMDKFYVYEVPIPAEFANTHGTRRIRVTLAFDPPTRHTRAAYLGVEMSFRLIRGKPLEDVIEHFRKRNVDEEGRHDDLEGTYNCKFDLGPQSRERGTLQSATFTMKRNPATDYGEVYYLVVRCERQWHPEEFDQQRFAVVVELMHTADIELYERVRERLEVRVRG